MKDHSQTKQRTIDLGAQANFFRNGRCVGGASPKTKSDRQINQLKGQGVGAQTLVDNIVS
jgi:hypothetical protein